MEKKKIITKRNIGIGIIVFLVLLQFVPVDKSKSPTDESKTFFTMTDPPIKVQRMINDGCMDCHSHEVTYPWYTNVAPVSLWIAGHIRNGRKKINFSTWGDYTSSKQRHHIEECIEVLEENRMPAFSYKVMHSEAKYSEADKQYLIDWFESLN